MYALVFGDRMHALAQIRMHALVQIRMQPLVQILS